MGLGLIEGMGLTEGLGLGTAQNTGKESTQQEGEKLLSHGPRVPCHISTCHTYVIMDITSASAFIP